MKCFLTLYSQLYRYCLLPLCFSLLLILSSCVSPEAVNNIEQSNKQIKILTEANLEILGKVHSSNQDVQKIIGKAIEESDGTEERESPIDGWEGLILIVLTLLGVKNGGQIVGFFKGVIGSAIEKNKKDGK